MNPPSSSEALAVGAKGAKAPSPVATDKELVNTLPSLAKASPKEVALMDAALGVGSPEGPIQSPSYTMGIAKVNQYYRDRNYELALMELNNLVSFYPNSPKLLKMKGTLLLKTGNHELAMRSWQRAVDLAPSDLVLGRAVKRLEERLVAQQAATRGLNPSEAARIGAKRPPSEMKLDASKANPLDSELDTLAH
ncbi:MAG: hypothetical protein NTV34_01925 [Proteobacteria bacterium]|nr:hypothetical protein [Pseudomonadota bacterium]